MWASLLALVVLTTAALSVSCVSTQALVKAADALEGEALSAELKVLSHALGQLAISAVEKEKLRNALQVLFDRLKKWRKEQTVRTHAEEALDGRRRVSRRAPFCTNA